MLVSYLVVHRFYRTGDYGLIIILKITLIVCAFRNILVYFLATIYRLPYSYPQTYHYECWTTSLKKPSINIDT